MNIEQIPEDATTTAPGGSSPAASSSSGQVGPLSLARQIGLLQDVTAVARESAAMEKSLAARYDARKKQIEDEYTESRQGVAIRFEADDRAAAGRHEQSRRRIEDKYEADKKAADEQHDATLKQIADELDERAQRGQEARDTAADKARSECEMACREPSRIHDEFRGEIESSLGASQRTIEECRALLVRWRQGRFASLESPTESSAALDGDPVELFTTNLEQLETSGARLRRLHIPSLFAGIGIVWLFIFLMIVGVVLGFMFALQDPLSWAVAIVGGPLVAGTVITVLMRLVARRQVASLFPPMLQRFTDAQVAGGQALAQSQTLRDNQIVEREGERNVLIQDADARLEEWNQSIHSRNNSDVAAARARLERTNKELAERHRLELAEADSNGQRERQEARRRFEELSSSVEKKRTKAVEDNELEQGNAWDALTENWLLGVGRMTGGAKDINRRTAGLFPAWSALAKGEAPVPTASPTAVRFGEYEVRIDQLPEGVPVDERLWSFVSKQLTIPALSPFPAGCSLVVKHRGEQSRAPAVEILQNYMLRLLTSIPPAKARFTIVDPVGLGENFAGFMHLADYDEALVTSRIWTDPRHIEQRLADLSEHMESVIQKYLRNEFATIEEYNEQAGEIAEPFRFLVVANFPESFSDAAIKRLMSIATTGARCGVFTLISLDSDAALPDGFDLKALERQGTTLTWRKDRFTWKVRELRHFPLTLDRVPPAEEVTKIVKRAGHLAREASKVEVPFSWIAPPLDRCWESDSSRSIDVPLGRAGATRLQHLRLGQGTSQHSLVAGKTGSGKSTLLHILVTNLALRYRPDEAEVYLVDFKKGVEFKTYATHQLPHARVIAIESDREFGLSVLERLDTELKGRADRFRDLGVQDIAGFRKSSGTRLPRILLLVDEFQELFTEDDRIAQDAALLLDRLVRQGRAFGIHVLLGSQTLGGAYSLARSTIGQMAVRIALQCSEADAHLILSEDNTAARLLSRPGEAIYNDMNGLVEGNHPFQIVWLPDSERERYLEHVRKLEIASGAPPRPQVVFEGNIPAEAPKNQSLNDLIRSTPAKSPEIASCWLGDAVAIKDPTAVEFSPRSGSNLLIVGQNEDSVLGMLATMLAGLYAQYPRLDAESPDARFYIVDGMSPGSPQAAALAVIPTLAPGAAQLVGWKELPEVMARIGKEVERRAQPGAAAESPIYLVICGIQRLRDLRRSEDDFSFSRHGEEKPPSPDKLLINVLREGSRVGVHAIVWCDSLNNLNRTFDRGALREFEMRILFQMSNSDSSSLIDSPAASRLGMNRALYHSEERGSVEKFRPYGPPPAEWLEETRRELSRRGGSSS